MKQTGQQLGRAASLLAIDTTTDVCSVGLASGEASGDQWVEHTRFAPRLHNRYLLAMVDEIFQALSAAQPDGVKAVKKAVRFISFGAGPGSFTGVRIGAAVAQGLAFAIGAQAIPIPSSAVVAETARAAGRRGVFAICRASRPGWRYVASYRLADDGVSCLEFDTLQPANAPVAADSVDGERMVVRAHAVAQLALQRLDQAVPAAQALPIYVEGDTPWRAGTGNAG